MFKVCDFLQQVHLYNEDYINFINRFNFNKDDLIFLDPPYKVPSVSEFYSTIFGDKEYKELLIICDKLHDIGISSYKCINPTNI